jgi:hypothetical protein
MESSDCIQGHLIYRWLLRVRPAELADLLKRILRIRRRPVKIPCGITLFLDPVTRFAQLACQTGGYDPQMSALVKNLVRPGDTFVDVGANEGYFTVLGSLAAGEGRVFALEPQSRLRPVIEENLRLKRMQQHHGVRPRFVRFGRIGHLAPAREHEQWILRLFQPAVAGHRQRARADYNSRCLFGRARDQRRENDEGRLRRCGETGDARRPENPAFALHRDRGLGVSPRFPCAERHAGDGRIFSRVRIRVVHSQRTDNLLFARAWRRSPKSVGQMIPAARDTGQ